MVQSVSLLAYEVLKEAVFLGRYANETISVEVVCSAAE